LGGWLANFIISKLQKHILAFKSRFNVIRVLALYFILLFIFFAIPICAYLRRKKDGVLAIRTAWVIAIAGVISLSFPVIYLFLNGVGEKFETINPALCDGIASHLYKAYEGTQTDLNINFTELIKSNTELLEGCTAVSYTKLPISDSEQWLSHYNIEKYNINYKCDLLSFTLNDIYKMENNFYILSYSLGPCGAENVYFHEAIPPSTGKGSWYDTSYEIEWRILNENFHSDNKVLCIDLAKKSDMQENICK
jgi:hypothetical protein